MHKVLWWDSNKCPLQRGVLWGVIYSYVEGARISQGGGKMPPLNAPLLSALYTNLYVKRYHILNSVLVGPAPLIIPAHSAES